MGVGSFFDNLFGGGVHHYYGSSMFPLSTIDFQATDSLIRNSALRSSNYQYNVANRAYQTYRTKNYKTFLQFNRIYSDYSISGSFTNPSSILNVTDLNTLVNTVTGGSTGWASVDPTKVMMEDIIKVYPNLISIFDYTGIYRSCASTACMLKYNSPNNPKYVFIDIMKCYAKDTQKLYDVIYPEDITTKTVIDVELQIDGVTETTLTVDLVAFGYISDIDELEKSKNDLDRAIRKQAVSLENIYNYYVSFGALDPAQTSLASMFSTDATYASKVAMREDLDDITPTGNLVRCLSYKAVLASPTNDVYETVDGTSTLIAKAGKDNLHLTLPPTTTVYDGLFDNNSIQEESQFPTEMSPMLELLADGSAKNLSNIEKGFLKYLNLDVDATLTGLEDSSATDVKAMTGIRPASIRSSLEPMLLYETLATFIHKRDDLTNPRNIDISLETHTDLVEHTSKLRYQLGEVTYTYGDPITINEDEYERKSYIHDLLIQGDRYVKILHPYLASVLARTLIDAVALYESQGTGITLDAETQTFYDGPIVSLFGDATMTREEYYVYPYYDEDDPTIVDQIFFYGEARFNAGYNVINRIRLKVKELFDIDLPDPEINVAEINQNGTGGGGDYRLNGVAGTPIPVGIKLWYDAAIKFKEYLFENFFDNLDANDYISHRFAKPRLEGPFVKLTRAFPVFVYEPNTSLAVKRYNKKIALVSDNTLEGVTKAYEAVPPATYELTPIAIDLVDFREKLNTTRVGEFTKPLNGELDVNGHPNALAIFVPNPIGKPNTATNRELRSSNYDDFGYKVDIKLVDMYEQTNSHPFPPITEEYTSPSAISNYAGFSKLDEKGISITVSRLNKKTKVVETIKVGSMSLYYYVDYILGDKKLYILTENNLNFTLPFAYTALSKKDKVNKVLSSYLFKTNTVAVVWADQTVYIKWYETEAFMVVVQIVAIIVSIVVSFYDYTGSTQAFIWGMVESYAISAGINYVVSLLDLSPELSAFVSIIATAYVTNGFSFENLSESLANDLWLQSSLTLLRLGSDALQKGLKDDIQTLQKETEELNQKKDMYDVDPVVHSDIAGGLRFFSNYFTQAPEITSIVDDYDKILETGTIPDSLFEFDYRMARCVNVYPYDP